MSRLHTEAFFPERGWSAQEFRDLLSSPHVSQFSHAHGFALVRAVEDEAELLTLVVDAGHRRQGAAGQLMRDWMNTIPARRAFLEVAADNAPALRLYAQHGFSQVGLRKAYYARPNAPAVDAVLMQAALTLGHSG